MIPKRLLGRQATRLLVGMIFCLLILHFFYRSSPKPLVNGDASSRVVPAADPPGGKGEVGEDKANLKSIRDYTAFFNGLEAYMPKSPSIKGMYKTEKAPEIKAENDDFLFSKSLLENVLDIPDSTYQELKDSHSRYVDIHMNKLIENYGISTFGNILKSDPEWGTYEGSSGYVLVGGERFNWLSYLVIKQIRATGSKMPIELFIAAEDNYEKEFCEELLPRYNAHCNLFDSSLSANLKERFDLGGYQLKMLAILSSKFENVMYVDSDNFPARNVDYIFESDLYKEKNLILWPDAWGRTTNPKFYEIAGVKVKENKVRYSDYDKKQAERDGLSGVKPLSEYNFENSPFHDFEGTIPNPTSETGMFVINKTSHLRTLLLCLYYNVFGPNYYYPLLTQGSAGEGDKETFIAAAHVMNEPWFQTLKQFQFTGYFSKADNNKFASKALSHYDPVGSAVMKDNLDVVFNHLSYPKYYPNWLVDNHDLIYEQLGEHIRMYSAINDNVGYDFDLRVLQFFTQGMCPNYYDPTTGKAIDGENIYKNKEYMGKYLHYVSSEEELERQRCDQVFLPHLKWLKETTKFPEKLVVNV
ncbi:unnamed protein product [Debaryomyces tyrocola]|nr:unnamed protein product [Debaryomyces tyrocola]